MKKIIELEKGEEVKNFDVQLSKGSPMDRIRKTDLIDFYYCPMKFKLRKEGLDYNKNILMERGIKFHEFADEFFDMIDLNDIPDDASRKQVKSYFKRFMPDCEEPLRKWILDFIEFEVNDYLSSDYFMPQARELAVEHPGRVQGLKLVGHIDRVDKIAPGEVAIIEYKPKASVHKLEIELAFYTAIWNAQIGQDLEATECHCYQYVEGEPVEIEPAFRRLVSTIKELKHSIEHGGFEKNYNSCSYCWFRDKCLSEEEIEHLLDGDKIED